MSGPKTGASPAELQKEIREAADSLGVQMDTALPFKPSRIAWLLQVFRPVQFTEKVIVPQENQEDVFVRAWLERKSTRSAEQSPVELLTDIVDVDSSRPDQTCQFGRDPEIAAVYDLQMGLELKQELGAPQEDTLARIQELGSYVSAITETELHGQLRGAVPVHNRLPQAAGA